MYCRVEDLDYKERSYLPISFCESHFLHHRMKKCHQFSVVVYKLQLFSSRFLCTPPSSLSLTPDIVLPIIDGEQMTLESCQDANKLVLHLNLFASY